MTKTNVKYVKTHTMWYNRPGPKLYCLFSDAPNCPTAIIELINKNYKNIKNDNFHKSEAQ